MTDPNENLPDPVADDSMRNLLSNVSAEEAAEVLNEVAPDMTEAEKQAHLMRWGKR